MSCESANSCVRHQSNLRFLSWRALKLHSCLRWWVWYSNTDWKEFLAALRNNMFRQLLLLSCLICSWNVSMVSANWSRIRLLPANSWGDCREGLGKHERQDARVTIEGSDEMQPRHGDQVRCGWRPNWTKVACAERFSHLQLWIQTHCVSHFVWKYHTGPCAICRILWVPECEPDCYMGNWLAVNLEEVQQNNKELTKTLQKRTCNNLAERKLL